MAFKNKFWDAAKQLDMVVSSTVTAGPLRAAHRVVTELQEEGPSWTGRFSNSWGVSTFDGRSYQGDGAPGEPRRLNIPLLTGRQAIKAGFAKDRVVYTVFNFSPWVGQAVDFEQDRFSRPTETPQTQLGLSKWEVSSNSRRSQGLRGDIYSGPPGGQASRTAPLDWFTKYATSGKLDRSVTIEMNNMFGPS
jgi:hypothetical protein